MQTGKKETGTTHTGNPLPLRIISDEEPLYSIRDVHMWEKYATIPSNPMNKYSFDPKRYWGHRYYGKHVVNKALDRRSLEEETALLVRILGQSPVQDPLHAFLRDACLCRPRALCADTP